MTDTLLSHNGVLLSLVAFIWCNLLLSSSTYHLVTRVAAQHFPPVANETFIRQDLAKLYEMTGGPNWINQQNWLNDSVSLCDWDGLTCSEDALTMDAIDFADNNLVTPVGTTIDISFLFIHMTTLFSTLFNGNPNLCLSRFDFSPLSELNDLHLQFIGTNCPGRQPIPVYLHPTAGSIVELGVGGFFQIQHFEMIAKTALVSLELIGLSVSLPFASLMNTPALQELIIYNCPFIESRTPDALGRSGANLTHAFFNELSQRSPNLARISFTSPMDVTFDFPGVKFGTNVPYINSSYLQLLKFENLPQLRTDSAGIPIDWMKGLPRLNQIEIHNCRSVTINTEMFNYSYTPDLGQITVISSPVIGDLTPFQSFTGLEVLVLQNTGISSVIPDQLDLSIYFQVLNKLIINNANLQLQGSIPSFANLPLLNWLDLGNSGISGQLPNDFLYNTPDIEIVVLSMNPLLTGPLPTNFSMDRLTHLSLEYGSFSGTLDALFARGPFPTLQYLNVAANSFTGTLPANLFTTLAPLLDMFYANNNRFTGPIPNGLSYTIRPPVSTLIFSFNQFSGPFPVNLTAGILDLSENPGLSGPIGVLSDPTIAQLDLSGTGFTCPIDLSGLASLTRLDLSSARFNGCNLNDPTQVQIPWNLLSEIDLSNNSWAPWTLTIPPTLVCLKAINGSIESIDTSNINPAVNGALQYLDLSGSNFLPEVGFSLAEIIDNALNIVTVRCINCKLNMELDSFLLASYIFDATSLLELSIGSNSLTGAVPIQLFAGSVKNTDSLPITLRILDFSNNPGLIGPLPTFVGVGYSLQTLDFSGCTGLTGPIPNEFGQFTFLQRLSLHNTSLSCNSLQRNSRGDSVCSLPSWITSSTLESTAITERFKCPSLRINSNPYSIVTMDPDYDQSVSCTCLNNFFGKDGSCEPCPIGCVCYDDLIQGCFPMLPSEVVIEPFVPTTTVLTCPYSILGETMCNPNGVRWDFSNEATDVSALNLTQFCLAGYTNRGCSQCESGYYSLGRGCFSCGSKMVTFAVIGATLVILAGLVVSMYRYSSSPKVTAAMRSYLDKVTIISSKVPVPTNIPIPTSSLKLLIYHCQMLGLLLITTTSQPIVLTYLYGVASALSSGFAFTRLVGLECLNSALTVGPLAWHGVAAVGLVLVPLACAYIYWRCVANSSSTHLSISQSFSKDANDYHSFVTTEKMEPNSITEVQLHVSYGDSLVPPTPLGEFDIAASKIARIFTVLVSLLYFLALPCAFMAISALGCTDTREQMSYLNLYPWQPCDSSYEGTITTPAFIGVLIWYLFFPIVSTILFRHLNQQVRKTKDLTLWPLCADLFLSFKIDYWYFEQLLLARRLVLVAVIALIPANSLALPVTLFLFIQACALFHHLIQPHQSSWLNRGELFSLYLFLINYGAGYLLQSNSTIENGMGHSLDIFSGLLFLVNLFFILILVAALSSTLQTGMLRCLSYFALGSTPSSPVQPSKYQSSVVDTVDPSPFLASPSSVSVDLDHSLSMNSSAPATSKETKRARSNTRSKKEEKEEEEEKN